MNKTCFPVIQTNYVGPYRIHDIGPQNSRFLKNALADFTQNFTNER